MHDLTVLYTVHTQQEPDAGSVSSMMMESVPFSGHILIVGVPQSLQCLFSLLAPFRRWVGSAAMIAVAAAEGHAPTLCA